MTRSASDARGWARAFCIALLIACGPGLALRARGQAEPDPVGTARRLGQAALAALEARDYTRAEQQLGQALQLHVAPTLYLARARARLGLGKLLAAAADLRAAIAVPVTAAPEHRALAQARFDARAQLAQLEPRIPTLTLLAAVEPVHVRVDGAVWPAPALGVARPLDPGEHTVEATDALGKVARQHLHLAEGQRHTLELTPASLSVGASSLEPTKSVHSAAQARTAAVSGMPPTTYLLGAVSLGLIAGAIATGFVALERRSAFNERNRPDVDMASKQRLHGAATTWAWVNSGLWAGALVSAGLTVYVTLAHDEPGSGRAPTPSAVQVRGPSAL